jgi:hypothetical protein
MLLPPLAEPAPVPVTASTSTLAMRSVRSPLTELAWPVAGRSRPEPGELDDPVRLCGAVVLAAVEALRSTRPLAQLARWVSPEVYESLSRATRPADPSGRATVRGIRVCRVSSTVAEGTAVVHDGVRVRAAAVRFEVHRGSWRATILQIG